MIMQVSPRIVSHNTKLDLFSKSTIVTTVAMHLGTTYGQSALSVLTHLILPVREIEFIIPILELRNKVPNRSDTSHSWYVTDLGCDYFHLVM